jgi:hypothetical protein
MPDDQDLDEKLPFELEQPACHFCLICDDPIPPEQSFCRYHWDRIPIDLRIEIHRVMVEGGDLNSLEQQAVQLLMDRG